MAFLVPAISAVAGVLGIASAVKGLTQAKDKPPAPIAAPTAPTPQAAAIAAAEESKKRRRAMASKTDITRGAALVPEVNVERKSLLGA